MIYDSKLGKLVFNLNTLRQFKKLTGKDALETVGQDRDAADNVEFVFNLYVSGATVAKTEVNEDAFGNLSFNDLADILNAFIKSVSVPGEVEAEKDTQPGQAVAH